MHKISTSFGKVFYLLCVTYGGAILQPFIYVGLVQKAPYPFLLHFTLIARRYVDRLRSYVNFDTMVVPHRSMDNLFRVQIVSEVLIALTMMAAEGFQFTLNSLAKRVEARLHVRIRNVSIVSQNEMLIILWSFLVFAAKVNSVYVGEIENFQLLCK